MKNIIFALALATMGLNAQITVQECTQLSKKINDTAYIDTMMENMNSYVENDCDSRIGEPTREKRLKEIEELKNAFKNK